MGRKKEADDIKRQADEQARLAETQERIANRFLDQSDRSFAQSEADRQRQQQLFDRISPVADRFINENPFAAMTRPARTDLSGTYRRNYADELAGIKSDEGNALASAADFATGSGAARTGAAGMGLGAVFRGSDAARTAARRGFQENLVGETVANDQDRLAAYEEEKARTGAGLDLALQGANILHGQQATFDPSRAASTGVATGSMAQGGIGQAVNARGQASQGYQTSANLPGRYSWLAGLAGSALGMGANLATGGVSGGLSNIWRRSTGYGPAYPGVSGG